MTPQGTLPRSSSLSIHQWTWSTRCDAFFQVLLSFSSQLKPMPRILHLLFQPRKLPEQAEIPG